jgi:KaiC/GvpD/RAD55 family RecA-like ATPase/DNA-binding response OmpR family regulator
MGVPSPEREESLDPPLIDDSNQRARTAMIRSGIAPLDERLGGVAPGRIHLVTGGLGTGKTAACLHFINAALREGERAAMLTGDRGSDLKDLARYLGIDLDTPLRDGRLQLLRFSAEFARRFAHSSSHERVFSDLRKMIGTESLARIAIDPLDPFLGEGGPVTAGGLALVNFLEALGATAMLTHAADPTGSFDRRLDAIIARSAAVVRLERGHGNVYYLGVVRARASDIPSAPLAFQIRRGLGIERYQGIRSGQLREASAPVRSSRKLLVLHSAEAASTEIVALLRRDYETIVRPAPAVGVALDLAATEMDGVVIAVSHDSVAAAIFLIARLNEQPDVVPIILAARFNLRSIDRARALRAGADEVLATDMSPPEFLQRLAATLSRPRAVRITPQYSDTLVLQTESGGVFKPLSRDDFAAALASHVSQDNPTQYTVVTFTLDRQAVTGTPPSKSTAELSDLVMRSNRVRSGDLTAVIENRVAVYLHGARQDDAAAFVDRVRARWTGRGRGSLNVESFPYPSGEPKLRAMIEEVVPQS